VRVDHREVADSRWYSGSGIYRDVWLVITQPIHVDNWGTYVYTPLIQDTDALVTVETVVVNESEKPAKARVTTSIDDAVGNEVATVSSDELFTPGQRRTLVQQAAVCNPKVWSIETPYLYTATTRLITNGKLSDEYPTPFGMRTICFDPNHGFYLNGQLLKIKGVCIHHDLGALGAAFFEPALERRLRLLKALGVNAIRVRTILWRPRSMTFATGLDCW
jgi:beta-galactosidase